VNRVAGFSSKRGSGDAEVVGQFTERVREWMGLGASRDVVYCSRDVVGRRQVVAVDEYGVELAPK